jgi:hypothetical protein
MMSMLAIVGALAVVVGLAGCNGSSSSNPQGTNIGLLKTIHTASSTVDPANGDGNPYALAIAPRTFVGDGNPAHVQPGDLVVSNFSNGAGAQFLGTTFEALRNGTPTRVFSETNAPIVGGGTVSTSGPVALAFGPTGELSIANFGANGDGSAGNVQEVTAGGTVLATLNDPRVVGGWSQAFNGGFGGKLAFFTVNIQTAQVVRINVGGTLTTPIFTLTVLTPALPHSATSIGGTPIGPGGLVHAPDDTLYVVDGVSNSIIAIPNSTTTTTVTSGNVVFTGAPLNQPISMTQNPINGDLIASDQKDNNLVEITTTGKVVATKTVDPSLVNDTTGANSALFGLTASTDASGNLVVFFCDDNDNTVKKLSL